MVRHLCHGEERRRGARMGLAEVHDLLLGVLHVPLLDERVDHVGVLGAGEHVLEDLRLRPLGVAHRFAQAVPLARLQRHHPDVAVLAGEDRGGRTERHAHPRARLEDAVLGVGSDVLAAHEDRRDDLGAGDVDVLAARLLASVQRRQAPGGGDVGAEEVGGEGAVLEGRLTRTAAVAVPGRGEMEGVEVAALPVGVGPRLAEGSDRDHHQLGVERGEARVVEPPIAHLLRRVVLDEDVRPRQQLEQRVASVGAAGVQRNAPLVRVQEEEESTLLRIGLVAGKGAPVARHVAASRRLDLHDVGAVVAEQLGAEGRRHSLAQLDRTDTLKGAVAHSASSLRGIVSRRSSGVRRLAGAGAAAFGRDSPGPREASPSASPGEIQHRRTPESGSSDFRSRLSTAIPSRPRWFEGGPAFG